MAKILFFELEPWEKEYIAQRLKGHKLIFLNKELSKSAVKKYNDSDILVLFVHSQVDKNILKTFKKLKLIATMSTGYDHIDTATCKAMNIGVCNVPYYGEHTVAEYTFALLLSLSRKIHETYDRTRTGNFSIKGLRGFDLKGKTLGVIGPGHIGQHVIKIAKGFEMHVVAHSRKPDRKLAKKMGFTVTSLQSLLTKSDVITVHVPYNKDTHHIINKQRVKMIKKGVVLLNTSRGAVVDTEALLYGLKKKIISGAGLDVLEAESFIQDERRLLKTRHIDSSQLRAMLENHMLMQEHNVIITPHNAFNTTEAIQRILDMTIDNVKTYIRSKRIKNKIV